MTTGFVPSSESAMVRGLQLQLGLRILLAAFIAATLLWQPPDNHLWLHWGVALTYAVVVAAWAVWGLRSARRSPAEPARSVALFMLGADLTVVAVLSVEAGISSPQAWTSDVLQYGLFLIPLIAAAQLDPVISAIVAVPAIVTFFAINCVNRSVNDDEPWGSIVVTTGVLSGLAAGSVALSWIQQSNTRTIAGLAQERAGLLEEVIGLEKRERQSLSERLHDGALQYVLAAKREMEEVREGSTDGMDRVELALGESSRLLRDVVRELHPEVLARSGLKAALTSLADGIAARTALDVSVDAGSWPDDLRTEADHLLYGAAREFSTNVIKHAKADSLRFTLCRADGRALLRIADDGVGIPPDRLAMAVENGHIGFASVRAKVLAAGGDFEVTGAPGTTISIALPVPGTD
ncbi:sensor histidine kinase [Mycolicibacterium fluoranthenivorans]|uniref:histidine kinase n=1 Tax=Mycolicibacterium fluoranthenivorans TaxID=258505 RepID=A0A7X5U1N1_9MYCO|nr:ATP-binding protein [Mycolicibacterium fluoranthenivorans]MCV7359744.1 ATP-binding protein [Mycolicibacterium fluoranthenivorans]NIH96707.1 two-component system NarL family sensor kinase [Mycolicibacterium fluoranthenivorans]